MPVASVGSQPAPLGKQPRGMICRWCLKNFEAKLNYGRKCCSKECREKVTKKRSCKPCKSENMEDHRVTFKNGTEHTKRICKVCRIGNYISQKTLEERIRAKQKFSGKPNASFYNCRPWLELKYRVFQKYGRICALCRKTEGQMHVDHIKPRSTHRNLELSFDNLQVLCRDCNIGKSNLDDTDWRE